MCKYLKEITFNDCLMFVWICRWKAVKCKCKWPHVFNSNFTLQMWLLTQGIRKDLMHIVLPSRLNGLFYFCIMPKCPSDVRKKKNSPWQPDDCIRLFEFSKNENKIK